MMSWVKIRKPLRDYPKTEQQNNVRVAGKVVGKICKGRKGKGYYACRHDVLMCLFKNEKCTLEVTDAKTDVESK